MASSRTNEPEKLGVGYRRYYLGVFLLGAVLLLLARTAAPGPTESGSLLGTVTDVDDRPLPGIEVALSNGHPEPRTTRTDERGRFVFLNLSPGNYVIEAHGQVTNQGYGKGIYESVMVTRGRATTLQMQLRRTLRLIDQQPIQPEQHVLRPKGEAEHP